LGQQVATPSCNLKCHRLNSNALSAKKNFKKIFGNCKSLSKIIETNNAKSQKNIDLTAVAAPKMLMQIQK